VGARPARAAREAHARRIDADRPFREFHPVTPTLLLGTSGYSYDEWHGVFYPRGLAKSARLDFYASVFRALEINSTYYGTPRPDAARRAVREARGRLAFSVKAPGDVTHRGRADAAAVNPFLDYLEPFREGGVLSAVLLQFPNGLHNTTEGRGLIRQACGALAGLPLAVELRHASWDNAAADAFLADMAVSRVAIDQPELRGLSESRRAAPTGPIAYVRFHGRNAAAWYGHGDPAGDSRYRYRYQAGELHPWIPALRDAAEKATSTLVFFNNHPDGNAILDALALATMLGDPRAVPESGDLFG